MRGVQEVKVHNSRVRFSFSLRRNITVIVGDSGTGKSILYDLVAEHMRLGAASGVTVECEKNCVALVDMIWQNQLAETSDSIVFVDEGADYVTSKAFAVQVRDSDNYYVIITRRPLHQLPYSIDEIYQIKMSGKTHTFEPYYQRDKGYRYGGGELPGNEEFDALLVEDSESGYRFYAKRFEGSALSCASSNGKDGIYAWLQEHEDEKVFVLADGAAFGSEAERVLRLQRRHPDRIVICLPESFEWLILRSGLVEADGLQDVLSNTSEHVDSQQFESWEQFYTEYLRVATRDTAQQYSKSHLSSYYLVPAHADKVLALISYRNVK